MALQSNDGTLNSLDSLPTIPKPGTISITNKFEGQVKGRVITKDAQIIVHDGTNNRILIGYGAGLF